MEYVAVLLPSACLAVLFYFVIKAIFNADRSERDAMARAEELQDAEDARKARPEPEKNGNHEIDPS
ncbi:hypothetical protein FJV46_05140 [Arthrobacter agilis]|nr:hypothetical protein [Arthrobacter agilis]OUM42389.1 hypothetical protein B8W74_09930 [Arthrobacter agilis]PPB45730.1 hypothetical protein CI784_11930 [Arthrobacter agilis]TPV26289.1 hypothetical protein FJV46_05140 [Arthrobacter agilis]VDR30860.1 Uncharacterised protein [Arthrobacter agilis]